MAITHEHIVEECWHVLENVGLHITSKRNERRFITAYQIYQILEQEENQLCKELIEECKGDFQGDGAHNHDGENDGQVKRIAQALGWSSKVETQYLDTRFLRIGELKPAGEDCGIFRIRS
jgi:hypothetical protein